MGVIARYSLVFFIVLIGLTDQAHAFGAGNIGSISRIEGQNWRHGDIEDALLTLFLARVAGGRKFSKLDVQRVYFGNWLRDYSQAVDVGTLKYVSADAIRILIWVLGFLSFGYGTKEFEVTTERLGCYEPTEHIDNPLGYAEGEDARNYDRRLRGPVDEEQELSINPRTGLKNYIATESMGIATSAALVRRVFRRSIQLGRQYGRSGNDEDLHEALRLLGTGLHCLEDYAAHSNYTELSLIELGESDVFPHVGRNTKIELPGAPDYVYPIVTGTFGGVDFFHSVLGELSDKAMQSEVQSLEGMISETENGTPSESFIQDLLSKIPEGLIGDSDSQADKMGEFKAQSQTAKERSENVSPREPEEWTQYLDDVHRQIYPVLEWHDNIIKSINEAIEKIPVLPDLIEQLQEQINVFVFSVLAPYVLPIIKQVKVELQTGSSEVIQSSREQQHIVFDDDSCSNPTHSMLSKDHFSNVLNEPAGRIASEVIKWTVPQLMECWDDENIDIKRTLDRVVNGVFHHPALRGRGQDGASDIRHIMFSTIQRWWQDKRQEEQEMLREQLSRDGILEGKNHKEGVHDCGHGCGKPLTLNKGPGQSGVTRVSKVGGIEKIAAEAAGGGAIGGLVGGLVSGVGSMLLNESGSRSSNVDAFRSNIESQQFKYGEHDEPQSRERHSHKSRDGSSDRHRHKSRDGSSDRHRHKSRDGSSDRHRHKSRDGSSDRHRHKSRDGSSDRHRHRSRDDSGDSSSRYNRRQDRSEYVSHAISQHDVNWEQSDHDRQNQRVGQVSEYYKQESQDRRYRRDEYNSQYGTSRVEHGGGEFQSRYSYESRPSYQGDNQGYYGERRNDEGSLPRYREAQVEYSGGNADDNYGSQQQYNLNRNADNGEYGGGYRDNQYETQEEYGQNRYNSSSGYSEQQQYGYGQRYDTESREYGY